MGTNDAAVRVAMDAVQTIADQRQGQVQVRRRADRPDATANVQVGDGRLLVGLVRVMDQVHAERQIAQVSLEPIDCLLDALHGQPRRPEEAQ